MGRFVKLVLILAFIAALLYAGSYAGSRATVASSSARRHPRWALVRPISRSVASRTFPVIPGDGNSTIRAWRSTGTGPEKSS